MNMGKLNGKQGDFNVWLWVDSGAINVQAELFLFRRNH